MQNTLDVVFQIRRNLHALLEDTIVTKRITIELDDIRYRLLEVLTCGPYAPPSVEDVIERLVDHAQQGVYLPGAWERDWLREQFRDDGRPIWSREIRMAARTAKGSSSGRSVRDREDGGLNNGACSPSRDRSHQD